MENKLDPICVLVVDDEKDIRDSSERILTRIGFEVIKASCSAEAMETLKRKTIPIILLDLKMPGMDEMALLRYIRDLDETILVVVIAGFATIETAVEVMKQGAYDLISKPFKPDQLRLIVNRAARRVRLVCKAKQLEHERKRTLSDPGNEKGRIHTIIKSLPNGVVVTDPKGRVVLMNPAFGQLLNLYPGLKSGKQIEDYIPDKELCNLVMEISRGKHVDFDDIPDYEFSLSEEKHLLACGQPVLGEKMECLGAVITFIDISNMKLLDRLKSEFVAKVSHELRSPLSTIHEQLALVIDDMKGKGSENDRHILTRAKEKTRGLISLIGDLLDLSRIEEGLICHDQIPVKLDDLLKNIVDFLETRAKGKSQTLILKLPKDPIPTLTADPIAMESIFGNLITNAINYTQKGGEIRIEVDLTGMNVRVKVMDNGFGIKPDYIEQIFERFYRIKDDKTRYITGTGLGLPIVKDLVDSMGGLITVESTHGKGSTFTVGIPRFLAP